MFVQPSPPVENPNAEPVKGRDPAPPSQRNKDYVEPTVAFTTPLTSWVYTIGTTATVSDPASRIRGGVQITVYEVEDGADVSGMKSPYFASSESPTFDWREIGCWAMR